MFNKMKLFVVTILSMLLVGCGGGGSDNSRVTPNAVSQFQSTVNSNLPTEQPSNLNATQERVPVNLTLLTQSSHQARQGKRRIQYISSSNTQMTITVTPIGGSPSSYGPTSCVVATCTVSFTANPGPNTIAFSLADGSGNVLSKYSTLFIIQPSTLNTISFSANAVVKSVTLALASSTVNGGTAANVAVTVNAKDPDGNIIVGNDNYVDSNGDPIALTLNSANSQAGGNGAVSLLGPMRITAPGQAATYAHYNGGWLSSSTISVSSSSSLVSPLTGTTLTTIPTINESFPNGSSFIAGIAKGPDGGVWFCLPQANKIERISPTGTYSMLTATTSTYPNDLVTGPDGNLWVAIENGNGIAKITTAGGVTLYTAGITAGAYPQSLAVGPDGNIWFPEPGVDKIAKMTKNGVVTEYSGLTGGADPLNIVTGADLNLWFTEYNGNRIGRITTSGVVTEFSAGITAGGKPQGIALGSDGNVWFVERSGSRIGRITTAGVITEFSAGLTAGAQPVTIVNGPDGALWFGEDSGGKIGRITTTGTITEYGNGFAATNESPQFVTVGPDGNIWASTYNGYTIARLVY